MYYLKRFFFQSISKLKFISKILHYIWIIYQKIRCYFKYKLYFKFNIKISSLSDRGQDKWIIDTFNLNKKNYTGFFLEIGGGDGFCNSNTFILEQFYNWKGILIEPNPVLYKKLITNRPDTTAFNTLIYDVNKKINFKINGELSQIINTTDAKDDDKQVISINSMRLDELLKECNAPNIIDFFSLDVEGSEEKVLTQTVLNKYKFLSLCIERPSYNLHTKLIENNYVFIKSKIYDCFYLNRDFKNLDKVEKKKFINFDLK